MSETDTATDPVMEDLSGDSSPPFRYRAQLAGEIEERWQRQWAADGTFYSPNPVGSLSEGFEKMAGRPKLYVVDMFPYPSGSGLHVGHPLGYIGSDVYARYQRMTGHHVLHTFGYDAFGLPAEQYAIETGQHPAVTTEHNIANMRRQLRRLGLGHDTRREIATTDIAFVRWTQWIFLKIFNSWMDDRTGRARPIDELVAEFEQGERELPDGRPWADLSAIERRQAVDDHRLAYISSEVVNWCPGLGTVLANEEVTADGRSDVGNYPVFRRPMRQWMLRITAYAERLIEDLELVDWPESIKQMQRNWISPSDGARISMRVVGRDQSIVVFTSRPDTISGATYVVLAPHHPLVDELVPDDWPDDSPQTWREPGDGVVRTTPREAISAYREFSDQLSDQSGAAGDRDKTGVFTGAHVVNPATGESIPVFVADYVLLSHGTGAIMAVPAHDQRDLDFARRAGLEVRAVLEPPAEWFAVAGGGDPTPASEWPEAFTDEGSYLPAPGVVANGLDLTGLSKARAIAATISWLVTTGQGRATRSYRLRDWLFSRQRYWGEPFPIVFDAHGLPIALPEDQLPVRLPEMADFRPGALEDEQGDPVPPLARALDWKQVTLDLGDGPQAYARELNTMPQWAGSCWYYLRYLDPENDEIFVDPQIDRYWMSAVEPPGRSEGEGGVDLYVGGVEHAVLHLLYARFWHKVLYDLGYVSTREPFRRLYNQGYILADAFTDSRGMYVPAADVLQSSAHEFTYEGEPVSRKSGKMGKSLKNGVSPEEIYHSYGADTLRLYEMAMGPLDTNRPWSTRDIVGVYRFLQRLWRCLVDEQTRELRVSDAPLGEETARKLHQTIKIVREDFGGLRFNIAIARLMDLTSHAVGIVTRDQALPRQLAEPMILMVAPLAPHIAEELWSMLGHAETVTFAPFPVADLSLVREATVELPVQINGKVRFSIEVPSGASSEQVEAVLREHPGYGELTNASQVKRLIVVPGKIVSIVAAPLAGS